MPGNDEDGPDEAAHSIATVISASGNLVVEAADEKRGHLFIYRTDAATLRQTSAYFNRLLDPTKFGEGTAVAKKLEELQKKYGSMMDASSEELPRVRVFDIGRISKVNSIQTLFGDFLKILHGQDLASTMTKSAASTMPLPNVSNLAVVADRFDALPHIASYIRRKRILEAIDGRTKSRASVPSEERLRQKLMVGVLFDRASWVSSSSQILIIGGSVRWNPDAPEDVDLPLWWDLPHGLEDELVTRRDYVLDTLQSIPLHFLTLYSSQTQQCRLGYDTSWTCDAFQLGKMLKFFRKNNLVKLAPTLTGHDEADPYIGSIERLIDILKSCPADRMDQSHGRCDLRTRLAPLLDDLEPYVRAGNVNGVGICGDCWLADKSKHFWSQAKRPVSWAAPVPRLAGPMNKKPLHTETCLLSHARVRDMFMATTRDWTPSGDKSEGIRFGLTTPFLKHD